jgi:hypothetical protein
LSNRETVLAQSANQIARDLKRNIDWLRSLTDDTRVLVVLNNMEAMIEGMAYLDALKDGTIAAKNASIALLETYMDELVAIGVDERLQDALVRQFTEHKRGA